MRAGRLLLFTSAFDQTISAPFIDSGSTVYPATLGRDQTINAPFIDSGSWVWPALVRLDSEASADQSMTVKAYSKAGSLLATLTGARARTFLDQIDDTGRFGFTIANDDSNISHTGFDRIIRFEYGGLARFAGVVKDREKVTLSQEQTKGQTTTVGGPGALALLADARVYPSRGVGALPIEEVRSFSWVANDFDYSSWANAKNLGRQDLETTGWDSTNPEAWPTPSALRIWGDLDTVSTVHAPTGTCLFRDSFTVATAGTYAFFAAWDNIGELYVDGAKVLTGSPDYVRARKVVMELSAGTHYIASIAENGADNGAAGDNPAYFLASCHALDRQGLLEPTATWTTSASTKCLPYVTGLPGFSPGKVLRLLVEDAQADSKLTDWTLDFTDTVDSDGEPWSLLPEITVGVGRSSLLDVVREMGQSIADVAVAPGSLTLRAWNHGTRGATKASVDLRNTTAKATSQLAGLSHRGKATRFNALLIRYAGGYTEITDATSISTYGRVDEYLELGWVQSEVEAQRIGQEHMDLASDPLYSTTTVIKPSSAATTPYLAFEVGDSPNVTDETGSLVAQRCQSLSFTDEDPGYEGWSGEFNSIALEGWDRHEIWLRRMASGALAGGSRVASPAGTAPITDEALTGVRVSDFSYEGAIANGTVVRLLKNGTSIGSVTLSAGEFDDSDFLDLEKVHGDSDYLNIEIDGVTGQERTVDTSGNLLTFQVRRTVAADSSETDGLVAEVRGI